MFCTWRVSLAVSWKRTLTCRTDDNQTVVILLADWISVHGRCTVGRVTATLGDLSHCSTGVEQQRDGTDFLHVNNVL